MLRRSRVVSFEATATILTSSADRQEVESPASSVMRKTARKKTAARTTKPKKQTTRPETAPKPTARPLKKAIPPPDNPLLRQQREDAALPGVDVKQLAAARQQALKRR